jgi:mannose-6-phosphate isomerase-like protein (cupin superfamily)
MSEDLPREVAKPWGSELWYAQTDRYAGKILRVSAGHRLSVQYHVEKDESNYLLSGSLLLEQGESAGTMRRRVLEPGAVWRNEPNVVHTIEAVEDSVILEVSTPELHDVVRIEDRYGRPTNVLPAGPTETALRRR